MAGTYERIRILDFEPDLGLALDRGQFERARLRCTAELTLPDRGSAQGGTWYYDPTHKGNAVRVMQGNPQSPYPNSRAPYVRWQRNGEPLDAEGNVLASRNVPEAHIPLSKFRFRPEVFE